MRFIVFFCLLPWCTVKKRLKERVHFGGISPPAKSEVWFGNISCFGVQILDVTMIASIGVGVWGKPLSVDVSLQYWTCGRLSA